MQHFRLTLKIAPLFLMLTLSFFCYAQNLKTSITWDSLTAIENNHSLSDAKKLQSFYLLKKKSESLGFTQDSVYALILHRIGAYEFTTNKHYAAAVTFTLQALRINTSGRKNCSQIFAVKSYYNLGYYYDKLLLFNNAIAYFDSTISLAKNLPGVINLFYAARLEKAYIFFRTGDFQKSIEESTIGLNLSFEKKDSLSYLRFLNQRAQALLFQTQLQPALYDVEQAITLAIILHDDYQLASAYKTKGWVYEQQRNFASAEVFLKKSVQQRLQTKNYEQISADYNDLGDLYRDSLHNYTLANNCYFKQIEFAEKTKDSVMISTGYLNVEEVCRGKHDYKNAIPNFIKSFRYLKLSSDNNFVSNPSNASLNFIGKKELILQLMANKTELLLQLFYATHDKNYLNKCLQAAMVTDSVITQTRHEQLGEQSKLYWRNRTRQFYTNALEASYLFSNSNLAFYFMEKSRSVLLTDKLNEIGASAHLPAAEEAKKNSFQINIIEQQQRFAELNNSSKDYANQQSKLYLAKEAFEHYIKSLEKKYPAYYQYKYADDVPSLNDLQIHLALNKQNFVYYFTTDTVTYILAISPASTKMIKLSQKDFNDQQLIRFLNLCSDKDSLNNHYNSFAALSNSIYKTLFLPLQIPKGRVIICADNFLIPFEALCTDENGRHFLLYDYQFSYVYSAGYLLKHFNDNKASGDFLGIAPVSFASNLQVPDLKQSAVALNASSSFYHHTKLLINNNASTKNFIEQLPHYTIVNIFSHARADSSDNEPLLFMQNAVIHLSELQLINNAATELVVLSACQTNVGKNATGEGIYSLARGFASAGISSVSATLWKADEQTIYAISETFNRNLSNGVNKDEALQNAKLSFIKNNGGEKLLPYYWANIVLVGNTAPVQLSANNNLWWWTGGAALLIITLILIWKRSNK